MPLVSSLDHSSLSMTHGGPGRHRTSAATLPPSRQASIGLGLSPSTLGKGANFTMGQFTVGSKLSSEDRFAASTKTVSASGGPGAGMSLALPHALTTTVSQGGAGQPHARERSQRDEKRNESNHMQGGHQQQSVVRNNYQNAQQMSPEPVGPLQTTANRLDRDTIHTDSNSPEMADRKVEVLLNKLTPDARLTNKERRAESEKKKRDILYYRLHRGFALTLACSTAQTA
ncbi:hypothetical protein CPB83DRAFT_247073 [Crepidotus variabilis]|uniref:Uncharacterized protein n=1 Tax=Crepidotus variabilis TaxID=179855 RepID=A0A9P6EIT3_9AGAR|nr:hypothetical protein CPB83DRAFT_247073 [Crepidotus variabilis]